MLSNSQKQSFFGQLDMTDVVIFINCFFQMNRNMPFIGATCLFGWGCWTSEHHVVPAGRGDEIKRSSFFLQQLPTSSPLAQHHSPPTAIWKPSLLLHISPRLHINWAHIISISFLFDCPPNKSCCSNNKRSAPLPPIVCRWAIDAAVDDLLQAPFPSDW